MGFGFPLMLLGLGAMAIPIVIHLLNRRRYDVVDWGAMQFLQVSQTTRRRLFLEEFLLMLLRMGLIAIMVCALAAPYSSGPLFAGLGQHSSRDVVLILDGSASMSYDAAGRTCAEVARDWARTFVAEMSQGDTLAIILARAQPHILLEPTHDPERVRQVLDSLPAPRGSADGPAAVQAAWKLLETSKRPQREIVILTDDQRAAWADDAALLRWELLSQQQRERPEQRPRIRVLNFAAGRPQQPPNWSLLPFRSSRVLASVGQQLTFRTAFELRGQDLYRPPHKVRLEVDDKPVTELKMPTSGRLEKGQMPLSFSHRFATAGSHLVSIILEPDPPPEQRPAEYVVKDQLPADNRQDFALEVLPALPVLLVDGDARPNPRRRGTDFLRDALSPARDPSPAVRTRVISIEEFDAAALTTPVTTDPTSKPRVVGLVNIANFSEAQQEAIARFVAEGGGVLLVLGDRVEASHYNEQLYRGGQGWLPVRLEETAGDETDLERAAQPLPASFYHPALELFRGPGGGLGEARFARWWRVTTPGRTSAAVPVALLTTNDPLFVERQVAAGKGRVLLSAVPLDNSWRSTLPDLPAFAPLVHELTYYLAGARAAEFNVEPGQALRYPLAQAADLNGLTLTLPESEPRPIQVVDGTKRLEGADNGPLPVRRVQDGDRTVLLFEDTRETGVYRFRTAAGRDTWYVVRNDSRESDLTACTDQDHDKVRKHLPEMTWVAPTEPGTPPTLVDDTPQELWWWFLVGVILLLSGEVWMTRRIALSRI